MKAIKFSVVLISIVGLIVVSCNDQLESPVSPSEQASIKKVATRDFSGTNTPTEMVKYCFVTT